MLSVATPANPTGFYQIIAAPDGNPMTMALLAIPMYILYEASIWVIVLLEKSWHRSDSPA